ncbi:MAG: serine/threonine protein kinase [Planctomycetaceae bacterium]|nr:serine/threonine protein kinase [Planctomycetaceae bacterium]
MDLQHTERLIVEGQLLTKEHFDEHRQRWLSAGGAVDDGDGFVKRLVAEHVLSEFQGVALRAGIPGPYMLGPYKVTEHLTAGRMGDVFRAEHIEFGQPVSLKMFPPALSQDPERLARLGREARVGLGVDHLHVVKTYQVGKVGDVPFIALEELNGETLEQRLQRQGRLSYAESCQLIQQAAEGLGYLHSIDVVHRDICPANLWITTHDSVKIMEFGAALDALGYLDSLDDKAEDGGLTLNSDDLLGHYAYMSAEQAKDPHSADSASDLYSLGCTLYHCLTGQVPFPENNPMRQMLRHATDTPKRLDEFDTTIPDEVQAIVSKLLAKSPRERFDSAEDVAAALAQIVPPAPEPELDPINTEFLQWLATGDGLNKAGVEFDSDFSEFLGWVAESKFDAVLSGRPTL